MSRSVLATGVGLLVLAATCLLIRSRALTVVSSAGRPSVRRRGTGTTAMLTVALVVAIVSATVAGPRLLSTAPQVNGGESCLRTRVVARVSDAGSPHAERSSGRTPAQSMYDPAATRAADTKVLSCSRPDASATRAPGGRMQGDRGAIDFSGGRGSAGNPLENVPAGAEIRPFTPEPGRIESGIKMQWQAESGQTVRFRAHGPDPLAPAGSNAASGPTYRVRVGNRYLDADGVAHPSGVHNPASSNYNPSAANATHMPFNFCIPTPWGCF